MFNHYKAIMTCYKLNKSQNTVSSKILWCTKEKGGKEGQQKNK